MLSGQMTGDVTGGQVESAAERNGHVRKVAADTVPPLDHLGGGEIRAPGTKPVFDVGMDPVANGLHSRQTMRDLPEKIPGEIQQFIGIAITAGERVAQ